MSIINKLSIRGIRSFGNDAEDEQKITFATPLTLIVGENGCGKTTIIECLKYALTGEPPHGSFKGKTFVHDPKIFNTSSSKGSIKLQITDVMGGSITCTRSMKLEQQKKGNPKFTTMDSTISHEDTNGKREDGHRRVDQTNLEMTQAMGVSKAILDNVIFCHQEDSNWPLDEGSKLKDKFNAIFGTTEYYEGIDKIIKIRKEYLDQLKDCVAEKKYLKETKEDAEKKFCQLELLKESYKSTLEEIETIDQELAPILVDIEKNMNKQSKIGKLQAQKTTIESSIENSIKNIENSEQKIKNRLDGDIDELKEQLRNFETNRNENDRKFQSLKNEREALVEQEKKLRDSVVKENSNSDVLADQIGKKQDLMSARFRALKKLSEELGIPFNDDVESQSLVDDGLETVLKKVHREIEMKEESHRKMVIDEDKKDNEFQQQIDKARVEKTTYETNLDTKRKTISKLSNEQQSIKQEISSIEASMPRINKLIEHIADAEKELSQARNEIDIEDLDDQRTLAETERNDLDDLICSMEDDAEKLESISKVTNELDIKQADLMKDENDFERIKNKQSSNLKHLFPSKVVDRNFKNAVQSLNDQLQSELKSIKSSLDEGQKKGNRLQTERNHVRDQHKRKEAELKTIEERIYKMCDGCDYNDVLTSQKEKVDKLNMELAFHKSSESTFKHYIRDIEQDPCCPLCHKNLESSDRNDLKEEIDDKIRQLPSRIRDTEKKFKSENEKLYKLNEVKSSYDNIPLLKKEIENLLSESQSLEKKYQENKQDAEDLEMRMGEPESNLKIISPTFFVDMNKLDELMRSIATKSKDVEGLKKQLPTEMPTKSLVETKTEVRKLKTELKDKSDFINRMNKQINDSRSKINSLQDTVNQLITKKVSYQEKVQGLDRLKASLKEKEDEQAELKVKTKEEELKLKPMQEKLLSLIKNKETAKADVKKRYESFQKSIAQLKDKQREVLRLNAEFESYEQMKLEMKIEEIKAKIKDFNKSIDKLKIEIVNKSKEIDRLNEEVNNQENYQRNLEDNLELRKHEQEKLSGEALLAKLVRDYGDLDVKKTINEYRSLKEKQNNINTDRTLKQGQLTEKQKQIHDAEKETNLPRYKNAKSIFMKECYKEATLKAMTDDLHKYRAALERSLLKFHADKMTQINATIRDLWNQIYKGNDIDYIKIKTDEDDVKATSDKKRVYNYRVVQAKNGGSEIDMRGRCSAGQKVLASLIIRIALADTFSANCGIFTLDEPTTNLDQNNIQALCRALVALVEERERNGHFMLLVITHDESFVKSMERAEHYFKVTRDHRGRSRIDKVQNI